MALAVGLVGAGAEAGSVSSRQLWAWSQGTLFLGEGWLLSGVSFLPGTLLVSLRKAGGKIQSSLCVSTSTLRMPIAAKAFLALMAPGMMLAIAQFALYAVVASRAADPASFAIWTTWLGPLRETAIGLLLAGIVLALIAISTVLAFQSSRITQLIHRRPEKNDVTTTISARHRSRTGRARVCNDSFHVDAAAVAPDPSPFPADGRASLATHAREGLLGLAIGMLLASSVLMRWGAATPRPSPDCSTSRLPSPSGDSPVSSRASCSPSRGSSGSCGPPGARSSRPSVARYRPFGCPPPRG